MAKLENDMLHIEISKIMNEIRILMLIWFVNGFLFHYLITLIFGE